MAQKIIRNVVHTSGPTCLAFSADGNYVLAGGSDCLVGLWKLDIGSDQEPLYADDAESSINTIVSTGEFWMASGNDSAVRQYSNPSTSKTTIDLASIVASSSGLPIRSIALDHGCTRLAVASDNLDVKIVTVSDTGSKGEPIILKGHQKGVRRVSWNPMIPILTSCGCDGKIIVWDANSEDPQIVKTIENILPSVNETSVEFSYDCSAIWHPSGNNFYVISSTNDIISISRFGWHKIATFKDNPSHNPITALALSPNGEYLVGASSSKLVIWMTRNQDVVVKHEISETTSVINQIAFAPTRDVIGWTDSDGAINRIEDPIPVSFPGPRAASSKFDALLAAPPADTHLPDDISEAGIDEEDDLGENRVIDDGDLVVEDDDEVENEHGVKEMVSITKAQPPFQPGATPMHHKKRYLAYNMLGVIEVTEQESHQIISIDFFDRSTRTSYHFNDSFGYNKGYLGERGALFACGPQTGHPAQVLYKPYESMSQNGDWIYQLDRPNLKVLGIASGASPPGGSLSGPEVDLEDDGNIVIATNDGDLTFLSGTGHERRIMGLGADFVSMVASKEWVFVVSRAGSTTIDGSQNLSYALINFDDFTIRQRDILPLGKGHTLQWIGITEEGAPAIYDTAGYLHVLAKFRVPHHASWVRILDSKMVDRKKGKDESYWPVGVSQDKFMCLILKGRQEYPGFPRPLIQEIPIRLPFRGESAADDERIERQKLLLEFERDDLGPELTSQHVIQAERDMDKEFVKLIQLACKTNDMARAFELAKLLHNVASIPLAIKVAEFYRLASFKHRLEALKAVREKDDDHLEAARDKRLQWNLPQGASRRLVNDAPPTSEPFQNFGPPASVSRPGLSRAKPVLESTKYSAFSMEARQTASVPLAKLQSVDTKRKRVELEEESQESDFPSSSFVPPPPAKKTNPFAKKVDQDSGGNPFARKVNKNKPIEKSESFFDKVDKAEADAGKRASKSKDKKSLGKEGTGPRQASLLSLLPKKTKENSLPPSQDTDISMHSADKEQIVDPPEETSDTQDMET